jgi:TPR repeat protein
MPSILDALATSNLGKTQSNKDFLEAIVWYRKAAAQGSARAQGGLGSMYQYGQGVPRDLSESARWFRMAALQGDDYGQYALGFCYWKGWGVSQDYVEAYKWFKITTDKGGSGSLACKGYLPRLAAQMTPEQIALAERLSRDFVPNMQGTP